jgi:hypothetical protein
MRYVAAALVAASAVPPYDEAVEREQVAAEEKGHAVKAAKRRRIWRLAHVSRAWKPTHAGS